MTLKHLVALLLLCGLASAPQALAQETETGITTDLERLASTTPQEKMQYAVDGNEEMRQAIKEVSKMLEGTRREGDLTKLQCLNNRLTSIRALLQVSESAETAMKEALSAGEAERADHEFRKIAVARNKAQQLRAEADQCISESGLKSGQTVVKAEQELTKPEDETEDLPEDFDFGMDPPESSPFM